MAKRKGTYTIDIAGQVFGRLTAVRRVSTEGEALWECQCSCGAMRVVPQSALRSGNTKSCGCSRKGRALRPVVHGMSKSAEHRIWASIKSRCSNPNDTAWHNYGGRGIRMCELWRDSFEAFYADMGPRPQGCDIDRIDNDRDYCPENCRWATRKQNSRNTRSNRIIEHDGKALCIAEWAEITGIKHQTLYWRWAKGWEPARILEVKP